LSFHQKLVAHPDFVAGRYDTSFIAEHERELTAPSTDSAADPTLAVALAVAAASAEARFRVDKTPREASLSPWVASHRAAIFRKR